MHMTVGTYLLPSV